MCLLPASVGHRGRAPPRDRLPRLGIRHLRAPCRPQTNGKGERFIRTMLSGWAYGAIYRNSDERTAALDGWLWHYNCQRRHSALGHKPSIARLDARRTNSRLTPRSHGCAYEPAMFADRATREDDKRSNVRRATPRSGRAD